MKITPPEKRMEALLDSITKFKSLSEVEQENIRPIFEETLGRFKDVEQCREVIDGFLVNNEVNIKWKRKD